MRSVHADRLGLTAMLVAAAWAGVLVGCAGPAVAPVITETAYRVDPKEPPPEVPPTWPLTGEVGGVTARAALAVKVENTAPARPQTGLEQADVIWEEMIEGGDTRFIAVYNSIVPDSVGPVRSVRPMDGPILGAVGGLLAFSGGQERFIAKARDAGLQVVMDGAAGFFRSTTREIPYNLYLRPAEIWAQADISHRALPKGEFLFAASDFAATAVTSGTAVTRVTASFSGVSQPNWTWDEDSRLFLRSERSAASYSASGVRLSAANVVVLAAPVQDAGGTDSAGSPIPDTKIVGMGQGLVATGGKAIEVSWSKPSVSSPITLTTASGDTVRLAVGQTWVELIPAQGGAWEVAAAD
ncbi:MAG: DUF3048 domain-containing protein [Bifidobacteriaceae bacterium]|jgi:hypothetical protein|nr:DUF3048 domain-containing protein [Bifidobacteriaceae bacterium]